MTFPPSNPNPTPEGEPPHPPEPNPVAGGLPPALAVGPEETPVVDAWASEAPPRATHRVRRLGWEFVQTLTLAILIFLAVRAMAQNFRVEGSSMEPGLQNGEYLLVNKAVYFRLDLDKLSKFLPFIHAGNDPEHYLIHGPQRGDIIVFRYPKDPSRDFIKRVIGVPGDTIDIADNGVSVNGVRLDEPYIDQATTCNVSCQLVVPPNNYFVLGDNRNNSSDSRSWGFVPAENIIGQAIFSYWPFASFGGVGNYHINLGFVSIPLP